MLRVGWFSTGRGEGSMGFLKFTQDRLLQGEIDAKIEFVFCNREYGEAEGSDRYIRRVQEYGIPLVTLSSQRFRKSHGGGSIASYREAFHREVMQAISIYHPDICVLAGYMLITSGEMVRRYRMVNLHPAAPDGPAGTWQEVIWKLIEGGANESGVMTHIATDMLDSGPILTYCTYPIKGKIFDPYWRHVKGMSIADLKAQGETQPLFAMIRSEGLKRECLLLFETLREIAEGRIRLSNGQVVDTEGRPIKGVCLNDKIDASLR